jgi:hypothetical protein
MNGLEEYATEFLALLRTLVTNQTEPRIPQWIVGLIGTVIGVGLTTLVTSFRDWRTREREIRLLKDSLYQELVSIFIRVVGFYETFHKHSTDPFHSILGNQMWDRRQQWLESILETAAYDFAKREPLKFYRLPGAQTILGLYKVFLRLNEDETDQMSEFSPRLALAVEQFENELVNGRLDKKLVISKATPAMQVRLRKLLDGETKSTVAILHEFALKQEKAATEGRPLQEVLKETLPPQDNTTSSL